jgi:hypothetical protein
MALAKHCRSASRSKTVLKLFANIFEQSTPDKTRLPDDLLEAAIERTVDGTDPRLRMLPAYANKLRRSVVRAAQYVIQLIDDLPDPVPLSGEHFSSNPALATIFYSKQRLERMASQDPALKDFGKNQSPVVDDVNVLLAVATKEKQVFATALVHDKMQKDVAQTTLSFDQHTFVDPATTEQKTRLMLKRRAFDHLLAVALSQLAERKEEREDLNSRKSLLRCKLDITARSGDIKHHTLSSDQAQLQQRLEDIEQQLKALGPDESVLPANLAIITHVLEHASDHLWVEDISLCVDRYYVLHPRSSTGVPEIPFKQIVASDNRALLVLMVKLDPELLPSRRPRFH